MGVNSPWRHYTPSEIPEPPLARFLFADTWMAWFWLLVRLYAGWQWFVAGFEKLTGVSLDFSSFGTRVGPRWVFTPTSGIAMRGFVLSALRQASGAHPSVQGWYANFLRAFVLPNAGLFAYLITFGELLVGLGILFGALTGIAAFFGLVMNFNYLLAGTVSTNPILGGCALFLMLAWRVAGYWGLDRWLLPLLGTPWTGSLTDGKQGPSPEPEGERPPTGALPA